MSVAHSLCIESGRLALDLHGFLRSIDTARWRADLERQAREQLARIRAELGRILGSHEAPFADRRLARLYEVLQRLAALIEEAAPRADGAASRLQDPWRELRRRLQPAYAGLASRLQRLAIPVPALRPTNYGRSLFHASCGLGTIALVHTVLTGRAMVLAAVGFALWCWAMEALRVRFEVVTRFYMAFLGRIAHPHEHYRVNSSTWYATALAILALGFSPMIACCGVVVLAIADPLAALVGRRFGRRLVRCGRTVEGSATFVLAGALAVAAMLLLLYPALPGWPIGVMAVAASLAGALAELYSGRLDDNVTIPVAAACGAALAASAFAV